MLALLPLLTLAAVSAPPERRAPREVLPFWPPRSLQGWEALRDADRAALGEAGWKEWDGSGLLLCPGTWAPHLPFGLELECIDGRRVVVGRDLVDTSQREGVIAYGIRLRPRSAAVHDPSVDAIDLRPRFALTPEQIASVERAGLATSPLGAGADEGPSGAA